MKSLQKLAVLILVATICLCFVSCKSKGQLTMELFDAVKAGDVKKAVALVKKGADVNSPSYYPNPLQIAAKNENVEMVKALIAAGANPNVVDDHDTTLLYTMAMKGNKEMVKALVEGKADVNIIDNYGYSPLSIAARKGHFDVVKLLVEGGADVNMANPTQAKGPLFAAAHTGQLAITKYLISKGAKVDAYNDKKQTPLHFAARGGHPKVVEYLIEHGGKKVINARDHLGCTAMYFAKQNEDKPVLKVLKKNGGKWWY